MIDFDESVGGTRGGGGIFTDHWRKFSEGKSILFSMSHAQTDSAALRGSFTDTDNTALHPNVCLPSAR